MKTILSTAIRQLITAVVVLTLLTAAHAQTTLKDAYKDAFFIGAAMNHAQIYGEDAKGIAIIKAQFNSITPENILKWALVHPEPNHYDFDAADKYVAFGRQNHMFIVGHNLVWHNQVPKWVFEDDKGQPLTRDALLARLHDHIKTVVGRYKGKINGWDVVNEALNEDGTMRQSPWMKIIGDDYLIKAFEFAYEADPKAELYYNDFSLENEAKRNGAIALVKKLKAAGVHITGVGLQGHDNLDWPTIDQQDATINAFANLGMKVMITELDIDVLPHGNRNGSAEVTDRLKAAAGMNPYPDGLPDSVQQQLAKRYADLFAVFLKHKDVITRVTFWGVTDGDSWKNNFPVQGRKNYPLLFNRDGKPKPAFESVINVATMQTAKR